MNVIVESDEIRGGPLSAPVPAPSARPASGPGDPPLHAWCAAHRELVASYRDEVWRFVSGQVNDPDEADDSTQQTLQQALQKLDSFRGGNVRAWLFCIARNVITSRGRASSRVQFVTFDELGPHQGAMSLLTTADSIQTTLDARVRIESCLECMEERLRLAEEAAVLLADVHGFSDMESAERMRMTSAGFKFLLHRARGRLHGAASRSTGTLCPLVSKTGVHGACPVRARKAGVRVRRGGARPSGLDEAALRVLRRELVDALGVTFSVEDAATQGKSGVKSGFARRPGPIV